MPRILLYTITFFFKKLHQALSSFGRMVAKNTTLNELVCRKHSRCVLNADIPPYLTLNTTRRIEEFFLK